MSFVIQQLTLKKGDHTLIKMLDLSIQKGEVMTLMGASGSGKSTLLSWIIGTLSPSFSAQGTLQLNNKILDSIPTEQRKIGILFQDDLLFPHMTVGRNIAFALPQGGNKKERREQVESWLEEANLQGFHDRDPATLSGGQRARVSVLRALASQPEALLLDEPFSKLDSQLRHQFKHFVFQQIQTMQIPALMVTHDISDKPEDGALIDLS